MCFLADTKVVDPNDKRMRRSWWRRCCSSVDITWLAAGFVLGMLFVGGLFMLQVALLGARSSASSTIDLRCGGPFTQIVDADNLCSAAAGGRCFRIAPHTPTSLPCYMVLPQGGSYSPALTSGLQAATEAHPAAAEAGAMGELPAEAQPATADEQQQEQDTEQQQPEAEQPQTTGSEQLPLDTTEEQQPGDANASEQPETEQQQAEGEAAAYDQVPDSEKLQPQPRSRQEEQADSGGSDVDSANGQADHPSAMERLGQLGLRFSERPPGTPAQVSFVAPLPQIQPARVLTGMRIFVCSLPLAVYPALVSPRNTLARSTATRANTICGSSLCLSARPLVNQR